jgi:hypothetical protein
MNLLTGWQKAKDILISIVVFSLIIVLMEYYFGDGIDDRDLIYIAGVCVGYSIAIITKRIIST